MKQSGNRSSAAQDIRSAAISVDYCFIVKTDRFGLKESGSTTPTTGHMLVVHASPSLIALSRKQGGLLHKFCMLDTGDAKVGLMLIIGDDELQIVAFELSTASTRALLDEFDTTKSLNVLLVSPDGDMRLMKIPPCAGLDEIVETARGASPVDAFTFERAMCDAAHCVTRSGILDKLDVHLSARQSITLNVALGAAEAEFLGNPVETQIIH